MIEENIGTDEYMEDPEGDGVLGQTRLAPPERERLKVPRGKLHCTDWLADIPGGLAESQLVEVQFKNTRKGYYRNSANLDLRIGDMVAVEANSGHDIGTVSLTGMLVDRQIRKANLKPGTEIKRIFRKAKPADIEKYEEACSRETDTMIRARKIAESLGLNMKIGDVEYQGDGSKAIFYYIADERVDFRQLIKVLADAFKVRIEMKQIGSRQEAGRIGGIGPCGRPLCCSSWMTNFVSVATSAARFQDISLNPQKLAGQCAKLKCCLNFEVDTYVESIKKMPGRDIRLETTTGTYFHFKTDIFKREITYSTDKSIAANLVTITAARAFEVIAMNREGIKPDSLLPDGEEAAKGRHAVHDILGDEDVSRFDKKKKKKKNKGGDGSKPKGQGRGAASTQPQDAGTAQETGAAQGRGASSSQPHPKGEGKPKPKGEGKQSEGKPEGNAEGAPRKNRRHDNRRRRQDDQQTNNQPPQQ